MEGNDALCECALSPADMLERMAAWKALAQEALSRTIARGKITSVYPRRDDIAHRLAGLIEAERDCCSFLRFDVREQRDVLSVELRFPPEFEPMVAMIVPEVTSAVS